MLCFSAVFKKVIKKDTTKINYSNMLKRKTN